MANSFITGGSGFIGRHLVDELLGSGHAVSIFDLKQPRHEAHQQVWVAGDILDKETLGRAISCTKPEIVVHLAANAEIQSQSMAAYASIHEGTRNLIDILERPTTVRRLMHMSTQFVVGPGPGPASETDFRPYTRYGESKARPSNRMVIVRPANIWGPYHHSFPHSIWLYLNKRYYLHPAGSRSAIRSYGYVGNAVTQITALLHALQMPFTGAYFTWATVRSSRLYGLTNFRFS